MTSMPCLHRAPAAAIPPMPAPITATRGFRCMTFPWVLGAWRCSDLTRDPFHLVRRRAHAPVQLGGLAGGQCADILAGLTGLLPDWAMLRCNKIVPLAVEPRILRLVDSEKPDLVSPQGDATQGVDQTRR